MKLRTDKLLVSVYANHGDTCGLAPHCKSLGCASGFEPDDYVLAARFAHLQEALDYCLLLAGRGVRSRLVSRICSTPYVSDYPKLSVENLKLVRVPEMKTKQPIEHLPN